MKSTSLLLALSSFYTSTSVLAKPLENRMNYDFAQSTVFVFGIYKPTEEKKNGLQAELEARKEAIKYATEQIQKSCGNDESKLVEGWRNSFKSLGSTIYPKGVLEIELSSTFKEVFTSHKSAKVQPPKTMDANIVVFKLPSVVASQISCGVVKIKIDSQMLNIVPISLTKSDAPLKTIPVSLEGTTLTVNSLDDSSLQAYFKDQITKGKGTDKNPLALPISIK